MTKNLSPPILQNQTFWPHIYMYIMYIYNILEHNSPNSPGEQLQDPLVKILPKARDKWEYGWALSSMLCSYFVLLITVLLLLSTCGLFLPILTTKPNHVYLCSIHHRTVAIECLLIIPTNTHLNQTCGQFVTSFSHITRTIHSSRCVLLAYNTCQWISANST